MDVLATVLDFVVLGLLAVGLLLWRSFGAGVEEAAKKGAEEAVARAAWPAVLARELEKVRGSERQELRFTSYGELWAKMRPLAIYDDSTVDQRAMEKMSKKLSDWYFSATGGLMLTTHNRDLYFALQDLVSTVADEKGWEAERVHEPKPVFEAILARRELDGAQALLGHLEDKTKAHRWPGEDLEALEALTRRWRDDVAKLAGDWTAFTGREQFAILQQVCSVVRIGLTNDVESRLR